MYGNGPSSRQKMKPMCITISCAITRKRSVRLNSGTNTTIGPSSSSQ